MSTVYTNGPIPAFKIWPHPSRSSMLPNRSGYVLTWQKKQKDEECYSFLFFKYRISLVTVLAALELAL